MLKNSSTRRVLAGFGGVLMLAGLGTTGTAMAARFTATLNGDNVAVGGGDPDGWGRLRVRVSDSLNAVCTDLEVRSIGRVTSAQIYRGRPGEIGDPVVNLDRPGGDNDSEDCDNVGDALADEIQASPADFYVEVRTEDFPNGALRGQLVPTTG